MHFTLSLIHFNLGKIWKIWLQIQNLNKYMNTEQQLKP